MAHGTESASRQAADAAPSSAPTSPRRRACRRRPASAAARNRRSVPLAKNAASTRTSATVIGFSADETDAIVRPASAICHGPNTSGLRATSVARLATPARTCRAISARPSRAPIDRVVWMRAPSPAPLDQRERHRAGDERERDRSQGTADLRRAPAPTAGATRSSRAQW